MLGSGEPLVLQTSGFTTVFNALRWHSRNDFGAQSIMCPLLE
ncbi:hypothetical protein SAMN05421752_11377 [Natronorubrum thiooxidans]|uniref:Uncharacterized protein n=1 Tax=Natronorubrum thiooxidans TaxID=308853 RepID=A0A1N7GMA1_9EURY|nr:hypothetical protein SAMN05421752_11377 [Natronorubrum thiooxidans]